MPAYFNLLKERNPELRASLKAALLNHLQFIETVALARVSERTPYWMGRDATLADHAFYPFFERFVAVEMYRDVIIPLDFTRLRAWLDAMSGRETVRALARPRDYYVERYRGIYADS